MFRYLAAIWNEGDSNQRVRARLLLNLINDTFPEATAVLHRPGIAVYCIDSRPGMTEAYVLAGSRGVVMGKLFPKDMDEDSAPAAVTMDEDSSSRVLASTGRELIHQYWGRYVAFLYEETAGTAFVIRDPTGGLPCFFMNYHGIRFFFSFTADCVRLGLQHFSVNWGYIRATLAIRLFLSPDTGLNEVAQVQPGECLTVRSGSIVNRTQYWDPIAIARAEPIAAFQDAVQRVRNAIRTCVGAWASSYPRILLNLSGGLDSSIVLACLRDAPSSPTVTCVNFFDLSSEGDERPFARVAASTAGCELIELERSAASSGLETILRINPSAQPWFYSVYAHQSSAESQLARDRGAEALFSGGGGDQHFFLSNNGLLAAADYVHTRGVTRNLLGIALDFAAPTNRSIWYVLAYALRFGLFHTTARPPAGGRQRWMFVTEEINADGLSPASHIGGGRLPPGKTYHIESMVIPQCFYDPLGRDDDHELVFPFVSQPLTELCLKIPTYVLIAEGEDRAVARHAFMHDLPPQIALRNGKGGATAFSAEVLRKNRNFVREILLDGYLVKERLLDRGKLEQFLATQFDSHTPGVSEVVNNHLSLEVWIKKWMETCTADRAHNGR